jgi:hypothetical protein
MHVILADAGIQCKGLIKKYQLDVLTVEEVQRTNQKSSATQKELHSNMALRLDSRLAPPLKLRRHAVAGMTQKKRGMTRGKRFDFGRGALFCA